MRRALALAREGWGQTAPNPLVGAVVVRGGAIVGEGFHVRYGEAHAERIALQSAGPRAKGAVLYVNLEPCAHHGKTPPCVDAIIEAGIRQVAVAIEDPNPDAGGGLARLRAAGIDVVSGVCADEARELNAPFLHGFASELPWTTLKFAVSLDGAIADRWRTPGFITSEPARAAVHVMRAGSDAVAVGMGTVLADDPLLTVRDVKAPRVPPVRVVFSRTGRLPLTSRLAQSVHDAPVIVFAESIDPSYEHLLQQFGVEVICTPSLRDAMHVLGKRGHRALLVEGGARLAASLLGAHLIHRLVMIQAPIILGADAANAFGEMPPIRAAEASRLRVVHREAFGDDLMTVLALDAR
jgi:diaminohydroxyphosphoribosylaminopyrimidine deaminase / 5-amino-6-(5-phosphoribosylamino)uracil reductase